MHIFRKVSGIIIAIVGVVLLLFSYKHVLPFFIGSQQEKFESLWEQDVTALQQSKSLPEGFFKAKEIRLNPVSENAKAWLKGTEIPVKTKPDGTHRLDILVDDWKDNKDSGAMIQYQLVDLKSGDTIWELGRTLTIEKK